MTTTLIRFNDLYTLLPPKYKSFYPFSPNTISFSSSLIDLVQLLHDVNDPISIGQWRMSSQSYFNDVIRKIDFSAFDVIMRNVYSSILFNYLPIQHAHYKRRL